ncbi:AlpA family transcriptional regulator [Methylobacter psychrophilus]|uniref:AlpA family transcriptional regulator n=1 Tax=Methylobacter psychrophilus TaxID=96941 RepID=UPI0021D4CE38|nr:AlpA family transcriptional regulator [Methylobacter psychrophilus]
MNIKQSNSAPKNIKQSNSAPNRIIRLPEVIKRTGLSRSTIYTLITRNDFPKKISLSTRAMGFLEREVDIWIIEKSHNRA